MELNKIPTLVVGLVVATLIVTVVAIPIIEDSSKDIHTIIQNSTERYTAINDTPAEDLTYTINENLDVVLNGEIITGTKTTASQPHQLIAMSDGFTLARNSPSTSFMYLINTDSLQRITDITFKSDGTYSANQYNGSNVYSGTYNNLVYSCNNGNMGIFSSSNLNTENVPSIWANNDSEIWILATYYDQSLNINPYMSYKGTIDAGMSPLQLYIGGTATVTYDSTPIILDETPFSKEITFSPKITVNSVENTCWNVQIIAPLEYTAYTNNDSAMISIINIIPILLIVSMLVSIVGTIFVRSGNL